MEYQVEILKLPPVLLIRCAFFALNFETGKMETVSRGIGWKLKETDELPDILSFRVSC
jgi:hypothetical protein